MSSPVTKGRCCEPTADLSYEAFLAETLRDEPRIESLDEDVRVHQHVAGETYWRVSGTDLHALLEARKFVLARAALALFPTDTKEQP